MRVKLVRVEEVRGKKRQATDRLKPGLVGIVSFVTCRGEEGREISAFLPVLLIDGPDWTMRILSPKNDLMGLSLHLSPRLRPPPSLPLSFSLSLTLSSPGGPL